MNSRKVLKKIVKSESESKLECSSNAERSEGMSQVKCTENHKMD